MTIRSIALLLGMFGAVSLVAAIPQMIHYQGELRDDEGNAQDTVVSMTFAIYGAPEGATALWSETHASVAVNSGLFNVPLGSAIPIPDSALAASDPWLGVTVGDDSEMTPRERIVAVAYAYRIGTVDGAAGGHIHGSLSGGGPFTSATGSNAFAYGMNTFATAPNSAVTGGSGNVAASDNAVVGGGESNEIQGERSFIGGGEFNTILWNDAFVGAGSTNFAATPRTAIVGGENNTASGIYSFIGGGRNNVTGDSACVVGGGSHNVASGKYSGVFCGGGGGTIDSNIADRNWAVIAGGRGNHANGQVTFIGGGQGNTVGATYSALVGGLNNEILSTGDRSFIGGGNGNSVSGSYGAVAGGNNNSATANYASVSGGNSNSAENTNAHVGGGVSNAASGISAFVGSGSTNLASGSQAVVCGGSDNTASSVNACVPGGANNTASGSHSFAAGSFSTASHQGSFVWSGTSGATSSWGFNTVTMRATGGYRFYTEGTGLVGAQLSSGESAWEVTSDSTLKINRRPADSEYVLARIAEMPVDEWQYRHSPGAKHMGPMAQDMYAAFGLGNSDRTISTVDADGVLFAAVKELAKRTDEIEQLKIQVAQLQAQLQTPLADKQQTVTLSQEGK